MSYQKAVLLILYAAMFHSQEPAALKIPHTERALAPGEIMLLRAESPQPLAELRAVAFKREFRMFSEDEGLSWLGLIGIDLDTRVGRHSVEVRGVDKSGLPATAAIQLQILAKSFPKRELNVDPKFVTPPKSVLGRIQKESERVRSIFEAVSPERHWSGRFLAPVPGAVISAFGKQSVYNGKPRSAHSGTDSRGATGTPIKAPNSGRVVLAADLYYSGNTVIIDHGLGACIHISVT